MSQVLDVARLQRNATYQNFRLAGHLTAMLQPAAIAWRSAGLIKPNDSFGMAAAWCPTAQESELRARWNDPYSLVQFAYGSGDESAAKGYIANAACKMRASARTGRDTLDLRRNDPSAFRDEVQSATKSESCQWGDFPWGGAVFVRMGGDITLLVAVSCLTQEEDDWVARSIGGFLGSQMFKIDALRDQAT